MTHEIINREKGFSGTPAWPGCGVGTAIGNRSGYGIQFSYQPPGGLQTAVQYIVPFPATPRT